MDLQGDVSLVEGYAGSEDVFDALDTRKRVFGIAAAQYEHEFVAARMAENIAFHEIGMEMSCCLHDQLVGRLVTQCRGDFVHARNMQRQHGNVLPARTRLFDGGRQLLQYLEPVRQVGQVIVQGLV